MLTAKKGPVLLNIFSGEESKNWGKRCLLLTHAVFCCVSTELVCWSLESTCAVKLKKHFWAGILVQTEVGHLPRCLSIVLIWLSLWKYLLCVLVSGVKSSPLYLSSNRPEFSTFRDNRGLSHFDLKLDYPWKSDRSCVTWGLLEYMIFNIESICSFSKTFI